MSKQRIPDPPRDIFSSAITFARIDFLVTSCLTVFSALVTLLTGKVISGCFCFSATPLLLLTFANGNPNLTLFGVLLTLALPVSCFLFWALSKKRLGWLGAALAVYAVDSVALLATACILWDAEYFLYLLYRFGALYPLAIGIYCERKLEEQKKLDRGFDFRVDSRNAEHAAFSTPLHEAQADAKARILSQAEVNGHQICYRRAKRTNELIVDGMVYDCVEMLAELPHCLTACVDGHVYHATLSVWGFSTIWADGEAVAKKFRMI